MGQAALMAETRVLLIRHAKTAADQSIPEPLWPLAPEGRRQAQDLARRLSDLPITAIYSSPFLRAVDTVAPLAAALGLQARVTEDLREQRLASGSRADWLEAVRLSWLDFDRILPGSGSSRQRQETMVAAMTRIVAAHLGETVVVSSHGNVIALFLNALDPAFGFAQWRAMSSPQVFRLGWQAGIWHWDRDASQAGQAEA